MQPPRSSRAVLACVAILLAACGYGGTSSSQAPSSNGAAAGPFDALTPPPEPVEHELPAITSVEDAGGQTIRTTHDADWTLVADDVAWVTGLEGGIGRFDATTAKALDPVEVPQGPCGALDAGLDTIWTLTCEKPGVARIESSGGPVEWLSVPDLALNDGETSIGADEGAVWAIADGEDCLACALLRIDPEAMEVAATYEIPGAASAVRAGLGGVWIVYYDYDAVLHVDPESGEVVAATETGAGPVFFDVGEGGVWVMNQSDGSVSHVDPATDSVVATIAVDGEIEGGDLTVGDGLVWLRGTDELVAAIDPATDTVVARFGKPAGSGSASAGSGQLWISAHDVAELYRIPIDDL